MSDHTYDEGGWLEPPPAPDVAPAPGPVGPAPAPDVAPAPGPVGPVPAPDVAPAPEPRGEGPGEAAGEPAWLAPPPHSPAGAAGPGGGQAPGAPPGAPPGGPFAHGASGDPWGGAWGWGPPGGWGPPPPGHGAPEHPGGAARRRPLALAAAALFSAAALLVGVAIGYSVWSPSSPPRPSSLAPRTHTATTTSTSSTTGNRISAAAGAPSNIAGIAAKVDPGLVDINTVLGDSTMEAAGTGMVVASTGTVLTNNHVIEGATSITATDLGNGHTYTATVVGYDRTADVAIIHLKNASGLKTVAIGNSASVSVGQAVVGIGNAGGTGGTPSKAGGSVTALDQAITATDQGSGTTEHLTGLIESNADIQPGDSGGPLVNTSGKVIGMDTAASAAQGFTFSGAATGQGYSIPINTAISIARQIDAGRRSTAVHIGETAFLGVRVAPGSASTRSGTSSGGFGFGARTPTATPSSSTRPVSAPSGAFVVGIVPSTPAQAAGLRGTDVITGLGGTTVTSSESLTKIIEKYHPGDTVEVAWTTPGGQSKTATVTLVNGPAG